jgi:hypothetical protein
MQEIITNLNILINKIKSKKIKKIGYMSMFYDGVHPGHCYALLKLSEICEKTIAIPLINKTISFDEALAQVTSISKNIPADYIYLPQDALIYNKPDIINEISKYSNGKEWNDYLSKTYSIPSYLIEKAYRGIFSFSPMVSISFRDMELVSELTGAEIISIRANKDFEADLQISLRCGMDQLNVPSNSKIASKLIRKQKRVFCYSWRNSNNFLPRRIDQIYSIKNGVNPNQFPKTLDKIEDFWTLFNKLPEHDYNLLTMDLNDQFLWREATVLDYNDKKAFLVISSENATSPYYPHDFMWLNFEKRSALVYDPNLLYSYVENYFSDKVDNLVEGMTDTKEIMTKMINYFKSIR